MEYSIQALSRLSGVTTRTLRWYDEIGLLKPSRVAESGYRYYGPAEVDRLQDILYYRALGVELARIKRCLDDPSFDRLAALRSHLTALEAERARLEGLIRSVRQTIGAEERKEIMDDKQKFEAFKQRVVDWHQETYGAEARGRYGDAEVDAQRRIWDKVGSWYGDKIVAVHFKGQNFQPDGTLYSTSLEDSCVDYKGGFEMLRALPQPVLPVLREEAVPARAASDIAFMKSFF